jgi:hypothetical protein
MASHCDAIALVRKVKKTFFARSYNKMREEGGGKLSVKEKSSWFTQLPFSRIFVHIPLLGKRTVPYSGGGRDRLGQYTVVHIRASAPFLLSA